MRIAIASDHAGFILKTTIVEHLEAAGHDVVDLGTSGTASVDYPDFAKALGETVAAGDCTFGVGVCGSGTGIGIAANKITGVRAAIVRDVTSARMSRLHNDANIVCFGERFTGSQVALDAVDVFLASEFEGGRHARRVQKIADIESNN